MTWIRFCLFVLFACLFVWFLFRDDMKPLATRVQHATNYTAFSTNDLIYRDQVPAKRNFLKESKRYKKLIACIGATIPQSREPPVADEATLKAERPTIYNGLYYQCANATAGCEHQKQRTQKQHIRARIRIHLHKLPCRSISSIGVRTLNVSRHRSSQLAFLSALSCHVRHRPSA